MLEYIGISDMVVLLMGTVLLLFWLLLYMRGLKYADLFVRLDDEDFPLKELYFVGYALTVMLHLEYKGTQHRLMRKHLAILYGQKYVDYYIRAIYAQRFTMSLTIACFAMPIYCFTGGSIVAFVAMLAVAIVAYIYYGRTLPDKIARRQDRMLSEFSEVVSKLALLVNAGMILHEAWEKVSASGDSDLYQEMQRSVIEMKNGVPETDAIYTFGQRCIMPEIKKFSSTLIQGITKGPAELSAMLTQQSKEVWETKQQMMRRKGERANSQLLFPMILVFIGILIMVLVPIFSGISG